MATTSDLEILVKSLEDEVSRIRERFEAGISFRNNGRRMAELDAWRDVREACSQAQSITAALIYEATEGVR